jgi:hypothetical protein
MDQRVDHEAGDRRAVRMTPDLGLGNDLLGGDEHRVGGPGDVGVHMRVAVDLAVTEAVGPVHMEDGHVGEEGGHRGQRLARVGILDRLEAGRGGQIRPPHGQRRQERHAHGRRPEAQPERQVAPLLEGHPAALHVLPHDPRHAPRQPDGHPGRHHAGGGLGHHHELALGAHEVAGEGEPPPALTEDLANQRHRGPGKEAAADRDHVTVADTAHRVVDAGELVPRRLRLGLQTAARRDEVPAGWPQARISHFAW